MCRDPWTIAPGHLYCMLKGINVSDSDSSWELEDISGSLID